jgi:tetratricopeptide (TPR) repeat protein
MADLTRRQDQAPSERARYPLLIAAAQVMMDRAMGDFAALQRDFEVFDRSANVQFTNRYAERAQADALLHDEACAWQDLALAVAAGPADSTVLEARWDISTAAGDWAQALDAVKALIAEAQKSVAPSPEFAVFALPAVPAELALATQYRPLLAYAEAMTGDTASASALISQTPADCYLCVRIRARIAATAGDATTADRWFAEAMRQAPDLPMAYFEWGQALLARGDLAGAAREFSLAHEKGPHSADALKAWGDVLVKQGHLKEALAKYDEALQDAPSWPALHAARAAAARRS